MFTKQHMVKYTIYAISILLILITYKTHYNQNQKYIASYNYYIMTKALNENDKKTAKKCAKILISITSNKIYNGISYLLLSKLAKNKHKYKKSKIFFKNYTKCNLILKNLINQPYKKNI